MSRNPTLRTVLESAIDNRLQEVRTCMPAKVVAVSDDRYTVDVEPQIKQIIIDDDGNEVAQELPIIYSVPLGQMNAGGFSIALPVAIDDTVLLVFSELDIEDWQEKGGLQSPLDDRRFHLSDAIAIPCLFPEPSKLGTHATVADKLVLGSTTESEPRVVIASDKIELGEEGSGDYVAVASKVKTELDALKVTVDNMVTIFDAHIHPASAGTTSATVTPQASHGDVGDPASTLVTIKE